MSDPALLRTEELRISYRQSRRTVLAVDGVSFDIQPGEVVGLVGESGSGKSTIARGIIGLAPVESGDIYFNGQNVTHQPFKARRQLYRNIQVVFQDPYSSLNPARTVGRTLAEPLEAYRLGDRAFVAEQVRAILEQVHLPADAADRYPRQFSGGQRQRIAIARALILNPQLVICDEPVSALDLSVQAQILNLLRELRAAKGLSYLFISHDLDVVRNLCDRVVVLYRGQIVETGPNRFVSQTPAHPYTAALHQASPVIDPELQRARRAQVLQSDVAITEVVKSPNERCPFAERCAFVEERCRVERPRLRQSVGGAMVACHRYPEWMREVATVRSAAAETNDGHRVAAAVNRTHRS